MEIEVYVGLGSNLGQPHETVIEACRQVAQLGSHARVSSLYRTLPQGTVAQRPFCNAAVQLKTVWNPHQFLSLLMGIERRFGRFRRQPWGPRTLDLDLLLYGNWFIYDSLLTVPHPRMGERRFVLAPLAELNPHLVLPDGRLVSELLKRTSKQEVQVWESRSACETLRENCKPIG